MTLPLRQPADTNPTSSVLRGNDAPALLRRVGDLLIRVYTPKLAPGANTANDPADVRSRLLARYY